MIDRKFLLTIKCHTNNTYVDTIINDLVEVSFLLEIELEFHLIKSKNYNENHIEITPDIYIKEGLSLPRNYTDFQSYYLDTYLQNTDIDIALVTIK